MKIKIQTISVTPLIPDLSNRLWTNTRKIDVRFSIDGSKGFVLTIPSHSKSNFASIPVLLRGLFLTTSPRQAMPAFIHDALTKEYKRTDGRPHCVISINEYFQSSEDIERLKNIGEIPVVDWEFATEIFREALSWYEEKSWRAFFLVKGVYLWGKIKEKIGNMS